MVNENLQISWNSYNILNLMNYRISVQAHLLYAKFLNNIHWKEDTLAFKHIYFYISSHQLAVGACFAMH